MWLLLNDPRQQLPEADLLIQRGDKNRDFQGRVLREECGVGKDKVVIPFPHDRPIMGLEKFRQFLHVGFAKSPPLIDVPDHGVAGFFQGALITEPFPFIAVFVALGGFSVPSDDLQVGAGFAWRRARRY